LNPIRSADSLPALLLAASLVDPAWLGSDRLAQAARAPGFAALARRAAIGKSSDSSATHLPDPGHEDWLQNAFGLPAGAPIAACSALADGAFQACWRLDPVNLHIGRDHLVLTDPARLALGADDARALAASIAELFRDEGLTLIAAHPSRWYLQETEPSRGLRLQTRSMLAALGRSIDGWQPTGDDARRWRRIVNEVQMSWYRHPVNERRESQGLIPVNSLWIEGPCPGSSAQGTVAQITDQITAQIASCGATAGRIAARRSATVSAAVDDPASPSIDLSGDASISISEPCIEASMALTIDDRLFEAQCAGDPQRWMQAWQSLDDAYFGPMSRAQAPWQRGATLVLAGDGLWRELVIGARRPWRFWQHRPTPDALLSGGAAR
jgi:hypothetical protein